MRLGVFAFWMLIGEKLGENNMVCHCEKKNIQLFLIESARDSKKSS